MMGHSFIRKSLVCWRVAQVPVTSSDRRKRGLVFYYSFAINKYASLDAYPLPIINDLINKMAVFSKMDTKSAYHHILHKRYGYILLSGPVGVHVNSAAFHLTEMGEMAQWLEREFTDWEVRGSYPTYASRLSLSRLGQPGSIPALVLLSGGVAARYRKGATAERDTDLQ
ncbi:hypothetical protein CRM22_005488 [Opisthorchis felineus]|uniref:Reverse transcriptase domain-containing protein n=1 Tax=Opisthorchis felineus TaxID=147828 RepID=A0A4V6RH00_OPIFE|nr:hypothetical protein CRM22_005488 [Opisthorchis felineus]